LIDCLQNNVLAAVSRSQSTVARQH